MSSIIFIDPDGTRHVVEAPDGLSLMEVALRGGIDAIRADCGGACACATCHVYVDAAWTDRVPAAGETEALMLEFVEARQGNSRLACQIEMAAGLNGLLLGLPAAG